MDTDRPGKEIDKDYRDIVNYQIDRHGWIYKKPAGRGYPRLFPSNKAYGPISIPKTAGSPHSLERLARKIRQRGGTWPPEGGQR